MRAGVHGRPYEGEYRPGLLSPRCQKCFRNRMGGISGGDRVRGSTRARMLMHARTRTNKHAYIHHTHTQTPYPTHVPAPTHAPTHTHVCTQVPGTKYTFGIDPLVGLIPVIGDAAGLVIGSVVIAIAAKYHVPRRTIVIMSMNQAVDCLIGVVPLAGDFFDFGWCV